MILVCLALPVWSLGFPGALVLLLPAGIGAGIAVVRLARASARSDRDKNLAP